MVLLHSVGRDPGIIAGVQAGRVSRALWYVESFQVPQTYSQVIGTNQDGTEIETWD